MLAQPMTSILWAGHEASGDVNLPCAIGGPNQTQFTPTDSRLSLQQQEELQALLSHYDRLGLFSPGPDDIGEVTALLTERSFNTGSAPAVSSRPNQHSHFEKQWLKDKIDELLTQGIIRPYTGPWVSTVVLIKKPGASGSDALRLCVDFRKSNSVTELDPVQLPVITEALQSLAGCNYYSSVDVVSVFWQIPMAQDSIHKTGFSTPFRNFAWMRMPFGLVNASATFQWFMSEHVEKHDDFLSVYSDNVDVASQTWEEHFQHVKFVLERCHKAGLKLKLSKCSFACRSAHCLGFVVDDEGIHTDPKKVAA